VGKPKAPKAPDYAAAAQQQGAANVNSAVASNFLNQINQVGPDGSLKYSYDYAHGYTDPQTGKIIPSATATTTLSPEQQKLYDQNTQISTALNDQAIKGIGYVADATSNPLTSSQFNPLSYGPSVDPSKYTTSVAGPNYSNLPALNYGKMPSADDFAAQRDQVTNALMSRLQPTLDQQQNSLDAKLANQGISLGSDAFKTAQFQNAQAVNDQRTSALLAGSQEQQRLFEDAMGIQGAQFGQSLAAQQAAQSRSDSAYQAALNNANLNNSVQGNLFQQGLASGQFNNQAVSQAIQQADYFKNQPLNMLNALRSGNQVQMPTFGNVSNGAQIGAAPVYAATSDQYNSALNAYNTKMQGYAGLMSGLGSLGSTAIKTWG